MNSIIKTAVLSALLFGEATGVSATGISNDSVVSALQKKVSAWDRLHVGGYGEVVMSRNFYSDNYLRYTQPDKYKGEKHGRFDLPHVVIYLGYDFGKGWSFASEIEFEHGGTESAVEIETEEAGEYEKEIERGGEVALEQFYIQKQFMPQLKMRVGMSCPVRGTKYPYRCLDEPETGAIWGCSCRVWIRSVSAIRAGFTTALPAPLSSR